MYFSRFSVFGLCVIAVMNNLVMVVSQEDLGEVTKPTVAVEVAELKMTEASSVNESLVDKVTTTEVPSASPNLTKTSTQKSVTSTTQIPTVPNASPKAPNCILLDLDAEISFQNFLKTVNDWEKFSLNSSVDSEFHGCPVNDDIKKPIVFGLLTSAVTLNFTAKQRTDGSAWYISSVTVSYNPAEVFKEKTLEKYDDVKTSSDEYFMETPMDKSFACSDPRTIALYNKRGKLAARMVLKSIQMQIYNIPKNGKYSPEFQCGDNLARPVPTDSEAANYRSDTVPIVVGSCLAVMTVLVIAGYAAYRSLTVKKLDYATMEE